METFAEIKAQGLVRHVGVSNFDVAQLRRAQAIAPVETLQPPYSLLERLAWTLHHPAVHGSIVGFRRPNQVHTLARAGNVALTDEDLGMIAGA